MRTEPFQVAVLGDFAASGAPSLSERIPIQLTRDSLAAALRSLQPQIELELDFCRALEIDAWDDFHPDGLVEKIPALRALLEARSLAADSAAARSQLDAAGVSVQPPTSEPAPAGRERDLPAGADVLDSILASPERRRSDDPEFETLISQIANASAGGEEPKAQDRWRAAIDRELAQRVRAVLHCEPFQRVEAVWRALRELVQAGDTDQSVCIQILHLTPDELREPGKQRELQRLIVEERAGTPGAARFDLVIGLFFFGDDPGELRSLRGLGELGRLGRLPVLVGAHESLAAADRAPSQEFEELRRSPVARWLGLCFPRVLLRLPYGRETDPVERFEFEECEGEQREYLWGHPASVLGRALIQVLTQEGTLARLPGFTLERLPLHVFRRGQQTGSQHPVERVLTDAAIKELIERGLLPLVGVFASDEARIVSLRALSGGPLFEV